DITSWDVSNVDNMEFMFSGCENFNGELNDWDVTSVQNMVGIFENAPLFNQDLSNWDVSNLIGMSSMFESATSFNQDLSNWDVSSAEHMNNIFTNTSLSEENKCAIHNSFSINEAWPYDWSESCNLSNETSLISPQKFLLHQNYPNPFNPTTLIKYDLPERAFVVVDIYDVKGRKIKNLFYNEQTSGYHSISWDATNQAGKLVPAGIYIYSIQTGNNVQTKKMILVK
ncbi:MAG: BspA family leucine-rich repeat surface protein, partial [Candidatus Neomarinimicrobiota bacterium]